MRVVLSIGLAASIAFAGCATHPAPPEFHSGTRLRAMFLDGGGGAKQFTGWFDSQLGVPCSFDTARDGALRCLPGATTHYFADSSCTQPVWYTAPCVPVPPYIQSAMGADACGAGGFKAIYPIGDPTTTPPVGSGQQGACSGFGAASGAQFIGVGPESDPSTFVAATERYVSFDDGALGVRERVADDGSSQILELVDGRTQSACAIFTVGAPIDPSYINRCVANATNAFAVDSDSTCTTPTNAATFFGGSCNTAPPSDLGIVYSMPTPGACDQTLITVQTLGATLDASSFFVGSTTSCNAVQADSVVRSLGSVVPADQFAKVETGELGTGRLRVESFMDREGNALRPGDPSLFDAQLQTPCIPILFADGTRCVPSAIGYIPSDGPFADSQCTQRLISQPTTPTPCSTQPDVFLLGGDACSPAYAAYGLGNAVTPTTLFSRSSSGCGAITPDPSSTYFQAVPVDDSIWPPLTTVTE